MKGKHTQIEWRIEQNSEYIQDGCLIYNIENKRTGQRVAKAVGYTVNRNENEALANAKLIASAPKLLEALIELRTASGGIDSDREAIAWDIAGEVIRQAT